MKFHNLLVKYTQLLDNRVFLTDAIPSNSEIDSRGNNWPNYTTNAMTFHSVLITFLSSVTKSLFIIPEYGVFMSQLINYAVTMQTVLYRLVRVMLLQDWSHHFRNFMVVIMDSWIITLYPSSLWKLISSICQ